jgi:phage shock protein A
MGILSRFREIMASNVNALLDKADNPEKTMDDYMRSLNVDLGKVKAETASVLADERRARRELDDCQAEVRKLQRYAEKSAEAGDDEGAIAFLERKRPLAAKEARLQAAYEQAAANAEGMKQLQDKLEADLRQLEARRAAIKGKLAATRAQQRLNEAGSPTGGEDVFEAVERKVDSAYYEAMAIADLRGGAGAGDDLDEHLARYEERREASAEEELAAIKRRLKPKE